jgi:hypothetical protein
VTWACINADKRPTKIPDFLNASFLDPEKPGASGVL